MVVLAECFQEQYCRCLRRFAGAFPRYDFVITCKTRDRITADPDLAQKGKSLVEAVTDSTLAACLEDIVPYRHL